MRDSQPDIEPMVTTIDEIRSYASALGAAQLVATLPTADGEAVIDYRPNDWLKITIVGEHESLFVLPPDWKGR